VQIGSRFVVWSELENSQYDIYAYDLDQYLEIRVTSTSGVNEQQPATSGPWVVWQSQIPGETSSRIIARNLDTLESRVLVDNGAQNRNPSMDGDLVTWESDVNGNFDVFIYRLSTSETFQVTNDSYDQYSSDVFNDIVAYVDMRSGNEDIYVSTIDFIPDPLDIDVSPLFYDFGNVQLGSGSTTIVTISNSGITTDLEISAITLQPGSSSDYAITMAPTLPYLIAPGGVADIEITFTPSIEGSVSAILEITCNDPDEPLVQVQLGGTGVLADPPSEQIADIIAYFDASVDDGTLWGDGPGNSADNRLNALRNMIEAAGDLIDDGLIIEASQQLLDAYQKCDGELKPPDFVSGPAAVELANLIQNLLNSLGG
jgi:beta propeller repeat protein